MARRLQQVRNHLRPASPSTDDWVQVREILSEAQLEAFRHLPRHDQSHAICVMRQVEKSGWVERDLLQAALLHDIGKSAGGRSPSLLDRTVHVFLRRISPPVLSALTSSQSWWNGGLVLAVHHPALGAKRAENLGCSPRACDLVARHADSGIRGDQL
ncbi:MAG: hypothetical protein AB7G88_06200, partial [Thermomicrobiales bacterium]